MKKILVVDDDPDILEAFQCALELENYRVFPLLSPRHIFKTVKSFKPDLIILDIMLNGMDGRAVLAQLKSNIETKKIPVMLVSARYNEDYIYAQNHTPDGYLEKPFDVSNLLQKIKALTEK